MNEYSLAKVQLMKLRKLAIKDMNSFFMMISE